MAIVKRSIGANADVLSVSLSASVSESPAKLTVTSLSSSGENIYGAGYEKCSLNFGGVVFHGSLLSISKHLEQGKNIVTKQYIDNSIKLDQYNIVLFRRGLTGSSLGGGTNKSKKITYPTIEVVASTKAGQPISFKYAQKSKTVSVARKGGSGAGALGQEEWASNPCESSNVTYDVNEALGIIGAPIPSQEYNNLRVSYEGSYRSVLSSIYSDFGVSYWWDWTMDSIKIIDKPMALPTISTSSCAILSYEEGKTREGTHSAASWRFSRPKTDSVSKTFVNYVNYPTSPIAHSQYSTDSQFLYDACPALKKYHGIVNLDFEKMGLMKICEVSPAAPITGDGSGTMNIEDREALWAKYNFDPELSLWANLLKSWGISANIDQIYLVRELTNKDKQETKRVDELFYPMSNVNYNFEDGDPAHYKKVSVEYFPAPTHRGHDSRNTSTVDGNNAIGIWRTSSAHVTGDTTASHFSDAVDNCIVSIPSDYICDLNDLGIMGYNIVYDGGTDESGNPTGELVTKYAHNYLRDNIEKGGCRLVAIVPPTYPISSKYMGTSVNVNDQSEVAGYADPNTIQPASSPAKTIASQSKCVAADAEGDSEETTPIPYGLQHANGKLFNISCNGKTISVVLPTLSPMQVTMKVTTEVTFNFAENKTSNTWHKIGGLNNTDALTHSVIITDITADEEQDVQYIPKEITSAKWLKFLTATCDGFYLPVGASLEAMSATLESSGLVVSYSYREFQPKPKMERFVSSLTSSTNNSILS